MPKNISNEIIRNILLLSIYISLDLLWRSTKFFKVKPGDYMLNLEEKEKEWSFIVEYIMFLK